MIASMRAYRMLVFHRDRGALLRVLKQQGVVHIKRLKREEDDTFQALRRRKLEHKRMVNDFQRRLPDVEGLPDAPDPDLLDAQTQALASAPSRLPELLERLEELDARIEEWEEDLFEYRHIGNYDAGKLAALAERGVHVHLFSAPIGRVDPDWGSPKPQPEQNTEAAVPGQQANAPTGRAQAPERAASKPTEAAAFVLEPLFDAGRKTWFATFGRSPKRPSIPAQAEAFPDRSVPELEAMLERAKAARAALQRALHEQQTAYEAWLERQRLLQEDAVQVHRADVQAVPLGFGKVILLQGWVPAAKAGALEAALDAEGYYYEQASVKPEDAPPVLLRNGGFGKLFEPIAELFALPQYAELDLTPFFAPFFLAFFGLCLGDGGYGLLVFLVLLALGPRIPARYKGLWKLALMLEAGAALLGVLSGTFFGINLHDAPWPWLDAIRPGMLQPDQLFNLSLALGAIQIAFGLILQAINRYRQYSLAHAIAPIGWLVLLTALGLGYAQGFNLPLTIAAWTGVALVLFFSAPDSGIGGRIGQGIWALYGITGFFGDLLSYIRLFALGLAGSILGFVVNDIAASILPVHNVLGPIFFVLMLLVGHSLNLFICTLGAFVHPMRLTFVEFYKNAGFAGGGEAYAPLQHLVESDEEPDTGSTEASELSGTPPDGAESRTEAPSGPSPAGAFPTQHNT